MGSLGLKYGTVTFFPSLPSLLTLLKAFPPFSVRSMECPQIPVSLWAYGDGPAVTVPYRWSDEATKMEGRDSYSFIKVQVAASHWWWIWDNVDNKHSKKKQQEMEKWFVEFFITFLPSDHPFNKLVYKTSYPYKTIQQIHICEPSIWTCFFLPPSLVRYFLVAVGYDHLFVLYRNVPYTAADSCTKHLDKTSERPAT